MIRGENHGIGDETVLMSLHSADHRGLRSWRLVVVNNTNTAEELRSKRGSAPERTLVSETAYRHCDSHLALRDSVHGTAHEGSLEDYITGDAAFRNNFGRSKVNLAGKEEEVVIGQAAVDAGVHEIGDGETIGPLVGLEVFKGLRGVEQGVGGGGHGGGVGKSLPD